MQTTHSASTPGASGSSLVRTFVGLAIVLAVIYGLYWVLKQVKAGREERSSGSGLSSVASLPLGPNRSVHLVKSGRDYVLVGASENGVTPIRTYSEEEAHDAGLIPDPELDLEPPAPTQGPRNLLEELRRRTVRK